MNKSVESTPFSWRVRVYQEDVDAGGIVYYANYLRYMERARSEWLRALVLDQSTLCSKGIIFVVRRCNVEYLRPAYLDDELEVSVHVCDSSRVKLNLQHTITRRIGQKQRILDNDENREHIANGTVTIACLSRDSMSPIRMPEHLSACW